MSYVTPSVAALLPSFLTAIDTATLVNEIYLAKYLIMAIPYLAMAGLIVDPLLGAIPSSIVFSDITTIYLFIGYASLNFNDIWASISAMTPYLMFAALNLLTSLPDIFDLILANLIPAGSFDETNLQNQIVFLYLPLALKVLAFVTGSILFINSYLELIGYIYISGGSWAGVIFGLLPRAIVNTIAFVLPQWVLLEKYFLIL